MLVRSLDVKDHYLTFLRSDEETRKPLYTQVPSTAVRGIVLHDRMILTQHGSFQNSDRPGNYCFRATVLGEFGDPRPNYERVWFDSTAIQRYLLKGTSSIVIDKMELKSNASFNSMNERGGGLDPGTGITSSPLAGRPAMEAWRDKSSNHSYHTYTRNGNEHGQI
jgi:hypothetical protein